MSHFISATLSDGTRVELSCGTSEKTMLAWRFTGFDFYASYEAQHCDGGKSGNGTSIDLSPEVAERAFKAALAWALAVQQEIMPEMAAQDPSAVEEGVAVGVPVWKLMGTSLEERLQEIGDPIPAEISEAEREAVSEAASQIAEMIQDYHPLSADQCERVLSSLGMVMDFTWAVYQGTRSGAAIMSFS